jgi:hypothetical protein
MKEIRQAVRELLQASLMMLTKDESPLEGDPQAVRQG